MADNMLAPEKVITIKDKDYTLNGNIKTLKTIQQKFDIDIFDIQSRILEMRFDELALLVHIGIYEEKPDIEDVEHYIINDVGVDEVKYTLLEWMVKSISPKSEREENVKKVLAAISNMKKVTSNLKAATK